MELKANELRIGNFINDEQTTHVVVGVDNYYVKSYWLKDKEKETLYETPIKLIKPIPLTEERLLKFGIAESNLNLSFIIGDFKVWVDKSNNDWYFVWKKQHIIIKHVHQLQNLYFALTNEELKLK